MAQQGSDETRSFVDNNSQASNRPAHPTSDPMTKSKAQSLPIFKRRIRKAAMTLSVRLNKAMRVLLKMHPGAKSFQQKSIFDKNYLLQSL